MQSTLSSKEFLLLTDCDNMASEQQLNDESEFHLETKPRLAITDEMQPPMYIGHKMDMKDRDPINMNGHVKVRDKNHSFCQADFKVASSL